MSTFSNRLPSFIGFDSLFDQFDRLIGSGEGGVRKNISNWPPYNVRRIDDETTTIEVAVAGFSKKDISITLDQNILVVSGNIINDKIDNLVFKGISDRSFERTFTVVEGTSVSGASISNGMLVIVLFRSKQKKNLITVDISD